MSKTPACFVNIGDTDSLNYNPIQVGEIPKSSGRMKPLPGYEDPERNKIFQFDEHFQKHRDAKLAVRDLEFTDKYYRTQGELPKSVRKFIIDKLLTENSEYFSWNNNILFCFLTKESLQFDEELNYVKTHYGIQYRDTLDALAMQVPEDLVIHALSDDKTKDFAEQVHLCHANGWSADWAINRDFRYIHAGIPGIEKIIPHPEKLVAGIIRSGRTSERVGAISFRTDTRLNRHPDLDGTEHEHKPFNPQEPKLHMRFERQTITGFPDASRFLFTIRTYFVNCKQEDKEEQQKIIDAFKNTDVEKVYSSNFLMKHRDDIVKWLEDE